MTHTYAVGTFSAALAAALFIAPLRAEEIKITIVSIYATDQDTEICPKLAEFAKEVQKSEPTLTGFKIGHTKKLSVKVGGSETCTVADGVKVQVTAAAERDEAGRARLTIQPPKMGEIDYACTCGKYFPIMTKHVTDKKQHLILAVMCEHCSAKEKAPLPKEIK
jgi:hypothetical protein